MDEAPLPYDRIGGHESIARLVDRFYDLMDRDPAYAALRAMHAPDLTPMRESLTDFLVAWTGGPRSWFEKRPGACIMSAHVALPGMTHETARQWIGAMKQAMADTRPGDEEIRTAMLDAMNRMCITMAQRAEQLTLVAAAKQQG